MRNRIKIYVDDLISEKIKLQSHAKARWKFENTVDWHHGHFVGLMSGAASSIYYALYKKQLSADDVSEIHEMLEEHTKVLRDFLKNNDENP